jgi:YYY domain-containing protein
MALALEGPDLGRAIVNGAGPRNPLYLDPPFKGWDFDGTRVITPTPAPEIARNFGDIRYWWSPSRALWDNHPDLGDPAGRPIRQYAITEFPFFSFWLGDMHPHVMALPFGVLALALALQTVARRSASRFARGWQGWIELGLTGVLLGSLYTINSWDFPTYVLLYAGALLLLFVRIGNMGQGSEDKETRRQGDREIGRQGDRMTTVGAPPVVAPAAGAPEPGGGAPRVVTQTAGEPERRGAGILFGNIPWRAYLTQLLLVCAAAIVLFLPFHLTFRSLVGSKEPLIDLPILATITRTLGFVTWDKTGLHSLGIIFGLFLVPLVVYVFAQGHSAAREPARSRTIAPSRFASSWAPWMPLVALVTVLAGELLGFPLLVLLLLAVYAALLALKRAEQPVIALTLWAFALGCLICFGVELVYIRDTFESRMNTIFKFYYQLWLIWGTLAAYAVWWLFARRPRPALERSEGTDDRRPATDDQPLLSVARGRTTNDEGLRMVAGRSSVVGGPWSLAVVGILFGLLLAGGLAYPWLTVSAAFRQTGPTGLQGKTPRQSTPAGVAAIEWLRRNTAGDAVVLEAVGPNTSDAYDTGGLGIGGVSASTGLATVLGWAGHQQQWRGGDPQARAQIEPRRLDVTAIYSGTLDAGKARELLDRYGVDYIYVGVAEQASYPAEGLARLAELGTPVFQQDEVTIYRVER